MDRDGSSLLEAHLASCQDRAVGVDDGRTGATDETGGPSDRALRKRDAIRTVQQQIVECVSKCLLFGLPPKAAKPPRGREADVEKRNYRQRDQVGGEHRIWVASRGPRKCCNPDLCQQRCITDAERAQSSR